MLCSKTFLIVDRDPLMREVLRDTLNFVGGNVFCVSTMREALGVLEEHEVDLIVTEYHLPIGTGLELIQRVENCGLKIPSALMIASEMEVSVNAAFAGGAHLVLVKPFGLNDFVEGISLLFNSEGAGESESHYLTQLRSLSL